MAIGPVKRALCPAESANCIVRPRTKELPKRRARAAAHPAFSSKIAPNCDGVRARHR